LPVAPGFDEQKEEVDTLTKAVEQKEEVDTLTKAVVATHHRRER
jgi:hypothetical protein